MSFEPGHSRRGVRRSLEQIALITIWVGAVVVFAACCSSRSPGIAESEAAIDLPDQVTVVFVPGVTGSKLRDRNTGEVLWGEGRNLIRPHDAGHSYALSIVPGAETEDSIEAFEVFDRFQLFGLTQDVYGPLLDALVDHGYRLGRFDRLVDDPEHASASLFGFPYDWRRDNVTNAIRLAETLESLRTARGLERLEVDLICQSNGTYLCRWLMKYGSADLDAADAGLGNSLQGLKIRKVIMIANANGGSIRILRELDRGRKYIPGIGRRLQPETLFTFRSLFQDLPAYRADHFVDETGEPMALDLYDAETWRRFGWSIFDEKAVRRIETSGDPRFGTESDRMRYLAERLANARRFQDVIGRDVAPSPGVSEAPNDQPTAIYLIQGKSLETPDRAVVVRRGDRNEHQWRLLFTGDGKLRRWKQARDVATASGDEHATERSQTWLAADECRLIAAPPVYVEGSHFKMILGEGLHREVIEALDHDSRSLDLAESRFAPACQLEAQTSP